MDLYYTLMTLVLHYFLRSQRYIKKFDYYGKRSQDQINRLSMTVIGERTILHHRLSEQTSYGTGTNL